MKTKHSIDDYKDRMTSPIGINLHKKPSQKPATKKPISKRGK